MLDHLFLPVFDPHVYAFVFLAIEVFFSLIFALFVIVLLYDQIRSIRYDLTYVEFLKQYAKAKCIIIDEIFEDIE